MTNNDIQPTPAPNISYPSSAAAVVFSAYLSAQAAFRFDTADAGPATKRSDLMRRSRIIRPCV